MDNIHHEAQPYNFMGNLQASYIQRGVYLLNCRKVSISRSKFYDASKVAIFMALYPQRRAFSDLEDIDINNIEIVNKNPELIEAMDWEIGLQLFDQNIAGMDPTRLRRLRMRNVNVIGLKTAISMQTKNDYRTLSPTVTDILFSNITGKTSRYGVMIDQNTPFENLSLVNSSLEVDTRGKNENGLGISLNGIGRSGWNPGSRNLTLQDLKVRSRVPAVTIGPVQGVNISRCSFSNVESNPTRQQGNLRLQGATDVFINEVKR